MVVYFWYIYQINWLMKLILFYLVVYCVLCFSSWRRPWFIQWTWFIHCHAFVWFIAYRFSIFIFRCLWFVYFHINKHFFDHIFCCRYQGLIGRHDPLTWSFLIGLIQNQSNIFIACSHNSLLSAMKGSSPKNVVSHILKLYQLFRSWSP